MDGWKRGKASEKGKRESASVCVINGLPLVATHKKVSLSSCIFPSCVVCLTPASMVPLSDPNVGVFQRHDLHADGHRVQRSGCRYHDPVGAAASAALPHGVPELPQEPPRNLPIHSLSERACRWFGAAAVPDAAVRPLFK